MPTECNDDDVSDASGDDWLTFVSVDDWISFDVWWAFDSLTPSDADVSDVDRDIGGFDSCWRNFWWLN